MNGTSNEAQIFADSEVPMIHIVRDFSATPDQLFRAHTDPAIFAQWIGPDGMETTIVDWDPTNGGKWRYVARRDGDEYWFRGCFHEVTTERIVQTFTWEATPDGVALETVRFESTGAGACRLRAQSLVESFTARDQWLASGMETGINEGYARLDTILVAE